MARTSRIGANKRGLLPHRHGPARPGHPHVPRQMARTSRAMTVWDRARTIRQRPGPPRISRASRILTSMITGPAMAWKGGLDPERLAPAKASFRLASRAVFAADPALVAERVHAAEHERPADFTRPRLV